MPGGLQRSANQKHKDPFKVDRYVLCRFQSRLDVKGEQTHGTVQIVVYMTSYSPSFETEISLEFFHYWYIILCPREHMFLNLLLVAVERGEVKFFLSKDMQFVKENVILNGL